LISRNKINEFFELLEKLAQLNDRNNLYEKVNQERYKTDKIKSFSFTANIIDIFNYNSQYQRLIIHTLLWLFTSFSFHGIFDILTFFNPFSNIFLIYICFFILCAITQILIGIFSDIYGRKSILTYSFYICSLSYLIFILTEEKILIKKIFFFICIIASSSLFSLLFIFTSEDFPTCIRGTVLGFLFGISQIIALIIYYINNPLVLCLIISLTNCIGGRLVESMEDTFELMVLILIIQMEAVNSIY
jgi:MFS family permease